MVVFRYDGGQGDVVEIDPVDNDFRYVASGDYWAVKVDEAEDENIIKWIPSERIYEIQGRESEIRDKWP